jgi:hypothetical protein
MRRLLRWPVIVAAICGVFIFTASSPMFSQTAYAQDPNNPGTWVDDAAQDSNSPTLECEILNLNPLSWFGCPVIVGLQETVVGLNKAIDAMMTINVDDPNVGLFTPRYKAAWDQFRIISIGLVIVAGLIMLASQAFGFEILDAYTVKKIMPRLILAVIFIALSWDILKFLVTLSNDAGNSVRAIIYQPFKSASTTGGFGDALQIGNWTKLVSALISGAAIVTLGIAGLLSFVATAFLAILIGFLVLLVRQLAITMLVMVAPFAIALYILPNTQKFFDFWKGAMISMLVVFPIISAFIATGRVFAIVAYGNGGTAEVPLIQQLSAFFAYFLPYAALPFAFKLAGGLIATVAGIVNDRGKGGFDRLSKFRQEKAASNVQAMKEGTRYSNNNKLGRGFNNMTFGAALAGRGGLFNKQRKAAAWEQRRTMLAAQHAKSDDAQTAQFNDSLLQAQTYKGAQEAREKMADDFGLVEAKKKDKSLDGERQELIKSGRAENEDEAARILADRDVEKAISAVKANGGWSLARSQYAANQLAATGTGYDNQEQMLKTIARVSNGNKNTAAALIGSARGAGEKAGRYDLKASFGDQLGAIEHAMEHQGEIPEAVMTKLQINATQGLSATQRATAKPKATENSVKVLTKELDNQLKIANDGNVDIGTRRQAAELAGSYTATLKNMEGARMFGSEQYAQALFKSGGLESSAQVNQNINTVSQIHQEMRPPQQQRMSQGPPVHVKVDVSQPGGVSATAAPGGGSGAAPEVVATAHASTEQPKTPRPSAPTPIYKQATPQPASNVYDIREAVARKMEQENSSRGQYSPQDIDAMRDRDEAA